MDEHKILIITAKGDQTRDIAEYEEAGAKVSIRFHGKAKVYEYNSVNVIIRHDPIKLDITGKVVLHGGFPLQRVASVLVFGDQTKVFYSNSASELFDSNVIQLAEPNDSFNKTAELLDYWKDISQYSDPDDEEEAFLHKQFARLNHIHPESALAVYMQRAPIMQNVSADGPVLFPFRFNLSQKQALEQAMAHTISIIQGPPGTGRTQTILNIIANAILHNKTAAVVSGNNAAVQNVQEKLHKYGYGFLAASLGNMNNRKAFFNNLPKRDVTGWACNHAQNIAGTINDLTARLNRLLSLANRKAELAQRIEAYRLEQKHFQLHYRKAEYDGMERLFYRRHTADSIIAFLADEQLAEDVRHMRLLQKAKLLFKYGFIRFRTLKKSRLALITRLQMDYYNAKLSELAKESEHIEAELAQASFQSLLDEHEANSASLFKHHLHERYEGKQPFSGNDKNYKDDFAAFINHFPVLLSTTHSLRECVPNPFLFDYVVIDEASQVDLLTGVLALSCCRQAIIVGDTKQLPQIVNEQIAAKLKSAHVDEPYNYFRHNLLSSMLAAYGNDIPNVILREHYRCHPKIIGFCNSQYYNNELIPFTDEADSDIPIKLHYTAKGNHSRRVTIKGKEGRFNHREIDVVKEEIIQELRLDHIPNEQIGFTTPYRLQVEEASLKLDEDIEIDTVHKYQGREKPIMIMSTVLDQTRSGQFGKRFVENPCLVNVAVSRAQKRFILVTDHALFRSSRKDIGNLIRYIEYNTSHEHVVQSELISVFDLLYREYSERLNDLHRRLLVKSRFKSENIIWRVLTDILQEERYRGVSFGMQIHLKDVFKELDRLDEAERQYVLNRASFDFVIYDAINKQPMLAIEVDGFESHRNNPDQLRRDKLKNRICETYPFPLLRLPTTGSDEINKIRARLNDLLQE